MKLKKLIITSITQKGMEFFKMIIFMISKETALILSFYKREIIYIVGKKKI